MNPNDIATKQDINQLEEKIDLLIKEVTKLKSSGENKHLEVYLTSSEVMESYKISKSHLTDLRTENKIPYSKPFGIFIYPKSEIDKIIKDSRSNTFHINDAK